MLVPVRVADVELESSLQQVTESDPDGDADDEMSGVGQEILFASPSGRLGV